jgi:hypothetical protein
MEGMSMGIFSSKNSGLDDDDMLFIFGGSGETGRPGKHRGGNLHGSAKKTATGKHGKAAKTTAKGKGKK